MEEVEEVVVGEVVVVGEGRVGVRDTMTENVLSAACKPRRA